MEKEAQEVMKKRSAEGQGKKATQLSDGLELPGKNQKENQDKVTGEETRTKWWEHESRVNSEIGVKGVQKTKIMMDKEKDEKKETAAEKLTKKKECLKLDKRKLAALEGRNKAIGAFKKARENLIVVQQAMNNVKPYDPSTEATVYTNKGNNCQMQPKYHIGEPFSTSREGCEEKCTEQKEACHAFNLQGPTCQMLRPGAVGDHVECLVNDVTGKKECNPEVPSDCNIYQKISGPGSNSGLKERMEDKLGEVGQYPAIPPSPETNNNGRHSASRQLLGGGGGGAAAPVPVPTRRPTPAPTPNMILMELKAKGDERQSKTEMLELKHELTAKTEEKTQARDAERKVKEATQKTKAKEENSKQAAIAEHIAMEKQKKTELAEGTRKAHNAESTMQEANTKAANADTQARHCEGEMYRRRRTCACDDQGGEELGEPKWARKGRRLLVATPAPYSKANFVADKLKMANWERRRYQRRRYVAPTAAARRRRYAFPAPPPPARIPGAVCPCCSPNQTPKSTACQLKDAKALEATEKKPDPVPAEKGA